MKTKLTKRIIAAAAAMMLISNLTFSQGAYVGIESGWGLSAGSQGIGVNSTSTTDEGVYGSFGEGLNSSLQAGYMFSQHFGAELGFSYLVGKLFVVKDKTIPEYEFTQNFKGTAIRIIPAVKVVGSDGKITPYAKFGFVMGIVTKVLREYWVTGGLYQYEYNGGLSMGWMGAFGLDFKMGDKMKLNAELNIINQSYGPDKYENISKADGNPLDPTITFDDEVNSNASNTTLRPHLPFGSFGISIGVIRKFGGK